MSEWSRGYSRQEGYAALVVTFDLCWAEGSRGAAASRLAAAHVVCHSTTTHKEHQGRSPASTQVLLQAHASTCSVSPSDPTLAEVVKPDVISQGLFQVDQ